MINRILFYFILLASVSCVVLSRDNSSNQTCKLDLLLKSEIADYEPIVRRIIYELTQGNHKGKTYEELAAFIDEFGNRIVGSKTLDNAIDYMLNRSIEYKLDNVHGEKFSAPHWERNEERAMLLEPFHRNKTLAILGLGSSVGTPPGGIVAEAVVVKDFDELKQLASEVKGKIVVYAQDWISYGETVKYRQFGAVEAAKLGAVASLIRSITPFSINSPHTGWQDYSDDVPKIPTACITVEDAEMLYRMYERGNTIKIFLEMNAKNYPPVESRNTVVEIKGNSEPERVVLLSGHLDSWDVGTGAMDDGGGAFISWYSLVFLKSMGLIPRRTLRTVLWSSEEEGLVGASAYRKSHSAEMENFTLLMESDIGTFQPLGLTFKGSDKASCIMKEILQLFKNINATQFEWSEDVGSDIQVWSNDGIPLASLKNDNNRYFWFHHSNGDTMALEDPDNLDKCTAVWAATAYIVANLSVNLPKVSQTTLTFNTL